MLLAKTASNGLQLLLTRSSFLPCSVDTKSTVLTPYSCQMESSFRCGFRCRRGRLFPLSSPLLSSHQFLSIKHSLLASQNHPPYNLHPLLHLLPTHNHSITPIALRIKVLNLRLLDGVHCVNSTPSKSFANPLDGQKRHRSASEITSYGSFGFSQKCVPLLFLCRRFVRSPFLCR